MNKFYMKYCALALTSIMSMATFSACGSAKTPGNVSKTATDQNFNATGFPIVKNAVTKRFLLRKPPQIGDPTKMIVLQEYEKLTNVHVTWDVVNSDGFIERVNLLMASNDMPDAILKGTPDITKSSADGSIIDISQLLDKYAPGLKNLFELNPGIKAGAISPDGKMYSIPQINTLQPNLTNNRNYWINKKWLDKLALKPPTTTDELLDVLKNFRDKDPNGNGKNDEIPMITEFSGGTQSAPVDEIAGSWGYYPNMGYRLQITNGKIHLYQTDDKWKEVLQYMNTLWKEKLLDNSLYSQTSDVALSKFNSNISGLFGLSSNDLWSKYTDDYVALPPPKNKNGDLQVIPLGPSYAGPSMVITKSDKTPEITMRWIDYFFTQEGSSFLGCLSPQLEGKTSKKLTDGSYEYIDSILNDSRGISVAIGEACPLPGGGFPYWRNEKNSNYIYSKKVKDSVPIYQQYYQKEAAYPYPVFSLDDSQKVNDIRKDLDVYLRECEAKFITGSMGFDKWDQYVATCKKLKMPELETYFQKSYDTLKK